MRTDFLKLEVPITSSTTDSNLLAVLGPVLELIQIF